MMVLPSVFVRAGSCLVLAAPLLLGACAAQPSEPTIFGSRILPYSAAANETAGRRMAARGSTIFGLPGTTVAPAASAAALAYNR